MLDLKNMDAPTTAPVGGLIGKPFVAFGEDSLIEKTLYSIAK